jgi:putative FmdB family regulatory protein
MPIYTYKCLKCDLKLDQFNHIDSRHKSPACLCGGETRLSIEPTQIQPVMGGGDFPGYQCVVTDKFITSRKERREIMKRENLVEKR